MFYTLGLWLTAGTAAARVVTTLFFMTNVCLESSNLFSKIVNEKYQGVRGEFGFLTGQSRDMENGLKQENARTQQSTVFENDNIMRF